ncbi:hypothetical protein MNBD_GAMMA09-1040 [hydrothermal vent metagenome]|uniref:Uncharacterized protein n=1 Tax=hydrothermal vent metagenome TaxID=652676 RepID=A0A3B0XXD7_9ZZZZ
MRNTLKVGLDIHGVIDAFPEKFKLLSSALVKDGAEVHIVTGIKRDEKIDQLLHDAGIQFTHYFSIVEHLEANNVPIKWLDGLPFTSDKVWDTAKRDYCQSQKIDLMFDDSPTYLETFHDIDSTYLHVINRGREIYQTR